MNTDKAQKTIERLLNLLETPAESVTYALDEKKGHVFTVKSAALQTVAAEREDIIRDLVYLLKRIFNKEALPGEELFKCTIDINDEQSKTDEKIKFKAQNAAAEARAQKADVLMNPMSSYERMVVHSTLAGATDISTESVGEGKERRVKVKYLSV